MSAAWRRLRCLLFGHDEWTSWHIDGRVSAPPCFSCGRPNSELRWQDGEMEASAPEPWYMTHARATGHNTIDEIKYGMRCLECPALPPRADFNYREIGRWNYVEAATGVAGEQARELAEAEFDRTWPQDGDAR